MAKFLIEVGDDHSVKISSQENGFSTLEMAAAASSIVRSLVLILKNITEHMEQHEGKAKPENHDMLISILEGVAAAIDLQFKLKMNMVKSEHLLMKPEGGEDAVSKRVRNWN